MMRESLNRKRLQWIDNVKGICMMAVILNHLYAPDIYGRITYPFELVGFFFVAGYTFNLKESFVKFALGKIRSLLVPIFCLGIINLILSYLAKGGSIVDRFIGLILQIPGDWDDLWFVACLFVMEFLFYFMLRWLKSESKLICACVLCLLVGYYYVTYTDVKLPWHLINALIFIPFLFVGYWTRHFDMGIYAFTKLSEHKWITTLFLIVIYAATIFIVNNYPIDAHIHRYGIFLIFLLNAIIGLCLVLNVSVRLEFVKLGCMSKFLAFIGANTLVYYAFQSKVISVLNSLQANITLSPYIMSIVNCVIVCIVLAIPAYVINRYFPFLLGRFSYK